MARSPGKAPAFIRSSTLHEGRGISFDAEHGIIAEPHADEEYEQHWACGSCGRVGTVRYWRTEAVNAAYTEQIYLRIDRAHHAASAGLCHNKRRQLGAPYRTGVWKDPAGKTHRRQP